MIKKFGFEVYLTLIVLFCIVMFMTFSTFLTLKDLIPEYEEANKELKESLVIIKKQNAELEQKLLDNEKILQAFEEMYNNDKQKQKEWEENQLYWKISVDKKLGDESLNLRIEEIVLKYFESELNYDGRR